MQGSLSQAISVNEKSKVRASELLGENLARLQGRKQDKNVEEQYISSLQDEIKYLEYELKLLKDKEAEQMAAFTEVDKFFADGVPINENILALKKQYMKYKDEKQAAIKALKDKIEETEGRIADLKVGIGSVENKTADVEEDETVRRRKFEKYIDDLRLKSINEDRVFDQEQKKYAQMQVDYKNANDDNLKIARWVEKDRNTLGARKEALDKERDETKKKALDKEKMSEDLAKELEKLRYDAKEMPMIPKMQTENEDLNKTNARLEKEENHTEAKNKRLEEALDLFEKKMNTLQLVKSINLDELKVILAANETVNSALNNLSRKWEALKEKF
eukprot:TRINITY_DN5704_c0_g2_i1.p1 TRINITY_DN5704_c0_g2~~TRINITY_DN5704_c0_g2_i1.p1  ORF type:complete len:332 (+),score=132.15 TRINITY_DN5704_c0_g2_i1:168-1163(+)